ncbi:MAG: LolA family protein [Desulfobacca sp.]|uniref:LolA family protein n=1 Tax=Desulfobacca sp. TaxID=2067990 RepID=UPI00404B8CA2
MLPKTLSARRHGLVGCPFWVAGLILLLAVGLGWPDQGRAITPAEVMARVQRQYDTTGVFKTRFRQESRLKSQEAGDTAEGILYFQKPSRMRWEYQGPAAQQKDVIVDGREVFIYLPQDKTVMIYPLHQVLRSDLVMRFFSGMGELRRDFQVAWHRPYAGVGPMSILLTPFKPQPELKELVLTIDPVTYLVQALEFTNAYGDFTRMTFTATQLQVTLDPGLFRFTPPPGVQVVRESM